MIKDYKDILEDISIRLEIAKEDLDEITKELEDSEIEMDGQTFADVNTYYAKTDLLERLEDLNKKNEFWKELMEEEEKCTKK